MEGKKKGKRKFEERRGSGKGWEGERKRGGGGERNSRGKGISESVRR